MTFSLSGFCSGARCRSCLVFSLHFLFGSAKDVVSIFATQLERMCSLNLGFGGIVDSRFSRQVVWNHLRDIFLVVRLSFQVSTNGHFDDVVRLSIFYALADE